MEFEGFAQVSAGRWIFEGGGGGGDVELMNGPVDFGWSYSSYRGRRRGGCWSGWRTAGHSCLSGVEGPSWSERYAGGPT